MKPFPNVVFENAPSPPRTCLVQCVDALACMNDNVYVTRSAQANSVQVFHRVSARYRYDRLITLSPLSRIIDLACPSTSRSSSVGWSLAILGRLRHRIGHGICLVDSNDAVCWLEIVMSRCHFLFVTMSIISTFRAFCSPCRHFVSRFDDSFFLLQSLETPIVDNANSRYGLFVFRLSDLDLVSFML